MLDIPAAGGRLPGPEALPGAGFLTETESPMPVIDAGLAETGQLAGATLDKYPTVPVSAGEQGDGADGWVFGTSHLDIEPSDGAGKTPAEVATMRELIKPQSSDGLPIDTGPKAEVARESKDPVAAAAKHAGALIAAGARVGRVVPIASIISGADPVDGRKPTGVEAQVGLLQAVLDHVNASSRLQGRFSDE